MASSSSQTPATRRRSSSQPPPNDVLVRHIQHDAQTPAANRTFSGAATSATAVFPTPARSARKTPTATATPSRRTLGTPHRNADQSILAADRSLDRNHLQTPATDKRKKRQEALIASAQRTREKRRRSIWGLSGWGGGREESPMDLLRRLARAPGFELPPTPQHPDTSMLPPSVTAAAAGEASSRGRDSLASNSNRSSLPGQTTTSSRRRSSRLHPGESVPGDLTRDSVTDNSVDMDESSMSLRAGLTDRSIASDVGAARRKSGNPMLRGGIFAALAERGRGTSGRGSDIASRLSLGGDTSGLSAYRENELEKSLALSLADNDSSLASESLDQVAAKAIERLDELTRQSLFSNDARLDDDDNQADDSIISRRLSMGRSASEPPAVEESMIEYGSLLPDLDDDQGAFDEQAQPADLSQSLGEGSVSAERSRGPVDESLTSIAQDASILSDSRSRTNILAPSEADISAEPRAALSDDGYVTTDTELADVTDEERNGESSTRRLDLMDPRDLNALLKRRVVKKRKARVSPYTNESLPQLPASTIKELFSLFAFPSSSQVSGSLLGSSGSRTKRAKLDRPTLEEVDDACHAFFGTFAQQLLTQSLGRTRRRGGGGTTINETDVITVLKQQGQVSQRNNLSALVHRLMPRELQDQMNLSKYSSAKIEVQTTIGAPRYSRRDIDDTTMETVAEEYEEEDDDNESEEAEETEEEDDEREAETSVSRSVAEKRKRPAPTTKVGPPRGKPRTVRR